MITISVKPPFLGFTAKRTPMISTDAVSYCTSAVGISDIIVPETTVSNRYVQEYMKRFYLKTAWIGIYATKHYPQWTIGNESQFIDLDCLNASFVTLVILNFNSKRSIL